MKTIKLPRRMGEITERLPASQYEPKTKETQSSMGVELRGIKRTNSLPNYHVAQKSLNDANTAQPQSSMQVNQARGSSGSPELNAPKGQRLANLADRAQRNLGLDIIEEGAEDETMKGDRKLYRPSPRGQIASRDASSIQRKNQQIIANAGIAAAKPTPLMNYHSAANGESRSA